MAYNVYTMLETSTTAEGAPTTIKRLARLLIVVSNPGQARVSLQARLGGEAFMTLATLTESGELNLDNYGWHEVRAVCEQNPQASPVRVLLSWR